MTDADTSCTGIATDAVDESGSCARRAYAVDHRRQLWPTDNDWGVPVLRLDRQATATELPFACWSRERRKSRMRGTWHFYTDDNRFARVWSRPADVLNSACIGAVECNFSVHAQMPRAMALWETYRKRWLARTWQEWGIRTFVDLNVAAEHADLNLLGVPRGWRAYCTRGSVERVGEIALELAVATERAGTTPLFVVYGGGRAVELECQRLGLLWFREEQDKERGRGA